MKILPSKLNNNTSRDVYWTRLYVESDQGNKSTQVLFCACYEYLCEKLEINEFSEDQLQTLLDDFIEEVKSQEDAIFSKPIHYVVRASTREGGLNALSFLENEINRG